MGVSGSGPFWRVKLPEEGQEPKSDEERMLLSLAAIKAGILDELAERRGSQIDEEAEETWEAIIYAVGGYLGQFKQGLPPTRAERDKVLEKIESAASKLEDEIADAPFHVSDLLHKVMRRQGADLLELKKQLKAISVLMPVSQMVRLPKGRPDPYLETLIRDLIEIWTSAVGTPPGKTGEDHYKGGRTSPFYRWSNQIARVGIGKKLSKGLVDTVIGLTRADG